VVPWKNWFCFFQHALPQSWSEIRTCLIDVQGEAYACCNLGVLYYRQRQHDEALTYFERFFEAARALKDLHVLDVARVNLGTVRAALTFKDYVQARRCCGNYPVRLLTEVLVIQQILKRMAQMCRLQTAICKHFCYGRMCGCHSKSKLPSDCQSAEALLP